MKVTCIVGSARSRGSCGYLVDALISGIDGETTVKKYSLGEMNIKYCTGCKKCYKHGVCIQNDDVKTVVEDIFSSDIVVIATPSYWADVPGQLKVFFDRNTPYGDTNKNRILKPEKNIKGIAIAVRAGKTEQENLNILNSLEHYFGHMGIEAVKRISICETDTLDDLLEKHQKEIDEIKELGKNLKNLLT